MKCLASVPVERSFRNRARDDGQGRRGNWRVYGSAFISVAHMPMSEDRLARRRAGSTASSCIRSGWQAQSDASYTRPRLRSPSLTRKPSGGWDAVFYLRSAFGLFVGLCSSFSPYNVGRHPPTRRITSRRSNLVITAHWRRNDYYRSTPILGVRLGLSCAERSACRTRSTGVQR